MATLAPGVLLKLLKGINSGEKPTNQYRSSLLQITDIVPADLDEKNLYPKHGFYVKVSDSSHSIYVSLPFDQDDLVMSNKIQLGQFIYVDKLENGSPVPFVIGARILPGRHPLVGTPEPLMGFRENGEEGGERGGRFDFYGNKRSSWEIGGNGIEILDSPRVLKQGGLDFDECTPGKSGRNFSMLPPRDGGLSGGGGGRGCGGGGVLGKMMVDMREGSNNVMMRKSCVTTPSKVLKFSRSKSVSEREQRVGNCSSNLDENRSYTPRPYTRSATIAASQGAAERFYNSGVFSHSQSQPDNNTPEQGISLHMLLPGKLGILGKEAVQQREIAQKIASQAVRDASATDNIVRALKKFSNASRSAKVDDPETCFNKFLDFHDQINQSLAEIASMQAAIAASELSQEGNTILNEIKPNEMEHDHHTSASKRKIALFRSFASFSEKSGEKSSVLGKHLRSPSTNGKRRGGLDSASATDENKKPESSCSSLQKSIDLGKQIKNEAGNWFMDFLEKYLESSKKTKGRTVATDGKKLSQSLVLKVINWVEMEQCKIPIHPKAGKIARKLRIKMKNP